jgi:hypothetical protein
VKLGRERAFQLHDLRIRQQILVKTATRFERWGILERLPASQDVKVKVKFTLEQAMKTQWGRRGIVPTG